MKGVLKRITSRWRKKERHAPHWAGVKAGPLAGLQFYLPQSGSGWSGAIVRGEYERPLLAQFEELARAAARGKGAGVLYDIGAHVGFFSCAWLRLGGNRVEAFEPVPANARIVAETAARNGLEGLRVHALALGHFTGSGTLMANTENLGKASMAYVQDVGGVDVQREGRVYRDAEASAVNVWKLDEVVRKHGLAHPELIKIDVEGAESKVLKGAWELIAKCRPALLIEIHNIEAGLEIAEALAGIGYQRSVVDANGGMPICRWSPG